MAGRQHIGGSQQIGEPVDHSLVFPPGAIAQHDGFRPEIVLVVQHPLGNGIQRRIPGYPFPLAAALGPDPAHGVRQPVRVVGQLDRSQPLAAQGSVIDGAVRIARNFGRFAVLGVDQHPAPAMAHAAVAFDHCIIAVYFHFTFYIGEFELSHQRTPGSQENELKYEMTKIAMPLLVGVDSVAKYGRSVFSVKADFS